MLTEAAQHAMPRQLRDLFITILTHGNPQNPAALWQQYEVHLTEDYVHRAQQPDPTRQLDDLIRQQVLYDIDEVLKNCGFPGLERLTQGALVPPAQPPQRAPTQFPPAIQAELRPVVEQQRLRARVQTNRSRLNADQRHAVDEILSAINSQQSEDPIGVHFCAEGMANSFFLDSPGGCGKTFTLDNIIASVRAQGQIVLCVASSGIAALLLDGGRTAHSRFGIPINVHCDSMCNIPVQSATAHLVRVAAAVVYDEAPMTHRHAIEALNRSFKDIMSTVDVALGRRLFGGKVIVFSGDFRQVLPVVKRGTRAQIVSASLRSTSFWNHPHHRVLQLRINMRVQSLLAQANQVLAAQMHQFADWLLSVGEGTANQEPNIILLPQHLCMPEGSSLEDLVHFVFGDVSKASNRTHQALMDRAILCPRSDTVNEVNDLMHNRWPGELHVMHAIASFWFYTNHRFWMQASHTTTSVQTMFKMRRPFYTQQSSFTAYNHKGCLRTACN